DDGLPPSPPELAVGVHLLTFESGSKNLGLTSSSKPHDAYIGAWRVSERLVPHSYPDLHAKGIGAYQILLERPVSTQKDVWNALAEAEKIAEEIRVAWCYAWTKPYRADVTHHSSIEAPEGWTGNLRKVEGDIQREAGTGWADLAVAVQYGWAYLACLPLRPALVARDACIKAPPVIRELIELHVGTHAVPGGRLFGLAKALEIAGARVPLLACPAVHNAGEATTDDGIGAHLGCGML